MYRERYVYIYIYIYIQTYSKYNQLFMAEYTPKIKICSWLSWVCFLGWKSSGLKGAEYASLAELCDTGVCETTLLLREPWPCDLAAETAIQPQIRCFQSWCSNLSSYPEECFFTNTGMSWVLWYELSWVCFLGWKSSGFGIFCLSSSVCGHASRESASRSINARRYRCSVVLNSVRHRSTLKEKCP